MENANESSGGTARWSLRMTLFDRQSGSRGLIFLFSVHIAGLILSYLIAKYLKALDLSLTIGIIAFIFPFLNLLLRKRYLEEGDISFDEAGMYVKPLDAGNPELQIIWHEIRQYSATVLRSKIGTYHLTTTFFKRDAGTIK